MKPKCLIVDIDNTLLMSDVAPYKEGYEFEENNFVSWILKSISCIDHSIDVAIVSTGRSERIREKTIKELHSIGIDYDELYMNTYRENGKTFTWPRAKEENLKLIMKEYEVEMVIDDDIKAIEMYKSYGLPCLQVHKWLKK